MEKTSSSLSGAPSNESSLLGKTQDFRQAFYKHKDIPRRERKEKMKVFGKLSKRDSPVSMMNDGSQ